jgi:transitional endoplasmic reticulum ATPase
VPIKADYGIENVMLFMDDITEREQLGQEARLAILGIHLRDTPLAEDVDLAALASVTDGMVGADLAGLCRRATVSAIREFLSSQTGEDLAMEALCVSRRHLDNALEDWQAQE